MKSLTTITKRVSPLNLVVLSIAVLSVSIRMADAAPFTVNFSGTVSSALGILPQGVGLGTPFSGSATFDTSIADSSISPDLGAYLSPAGSPYGLTINLGGQVFTSSQVNVQILNNNGGIDRFGLFSAGTMSPSVFLFSLLFVDNTQTLFSDDSLASALPLVPFGQASLQFSFSQGVPINWIVLSNATAGPATLPLPSTLPLLAVGLAILTLFRLRTSH